MYMGIDWLKMFCSEMFKLIYILILDTKKTILELSVLTVAQFKPHKSNCKKHP